MKQAEFARKIGLAQNSYNRYESGERIPDIAVLTRLAARLGVSTDWLLGLDGGSAAPATAALPDKVAESRDPGSALGTGPCGVGRDVLPYSPQARAGDNAHLIAAIQTPPFNRLLSLAGNP